MSDIETGTETKYTRFSANAEEDPEEDDEVLEDIPAWTFLELVVSLLAAGTMVLSICAIIFAGPNVLVTVSGIIGLFIPPYSAYQEQKITDIKAMEETNEAMDREVNNLKHENGRLNEENKKLESSVANLQGLTLVFEEIREMEDASLDFLEEQLKESEKILDQMADSNLDAVLNNIFDILLAADKDADEILSDEEIDHLIKKIEGINNVEINDVLAKKLIIEAGRGVDAVMKLVKNLIDDDPLTGPKVDEKVFTFL